MSTISRVEGTALQSVPRRTALAMLVAVPLVVSGAGATTPYLNDDPPANAMDRDTIVRAIAGDLLIAISELTAVAAADPTDARHDRLYDGVLALMKATEARVAHRYGTAASIIMAQAYESTDRAFAAITAHGSQETPPLPGGRPA